MDKGHSELPSDPLSWNRFAMTRGNPLKRTDPDGAADQVMWDYHFATKDLGIEGKRAFDSGVSSGLALGVAGLLSAPLLVPELGGGLIYYTAPRVTDPRLQRAVRELFRRGDTLRGGTARAIQIQLKSGKLIGGKDHVIKGIERRTQLEKIIARGGLSAEDLRVAQGLYADLTKVLTPLTKELNLPLSEVLIGLKNGSICLPPQ